jgi:hypothetical protein
MAKRAVTFKLPKGEGSGSNEEAVVKSHRAEPPFVENDVIV